MVRIVPLGGRPGSWAVPVAVGALGAVLLSGCAERVPAAAGPTPEAICAVVKGHSGQLPLGDLDALPTASPEELQTAVEITTAAYSSMAQVATPEFAETLDVVRKGLTELDAELARAGYDWDQVDVSALSAVFTPDFDAALRTVVTYLRETCQIEITLPRT
jgi:hypothetical protein